MAVRWGYNPITEEWTILSEIMNGYPFATDAETLAGVVDVKAITPASLASIVDVEGGIAGKDAVDEALALKVNVSELPDTILPEITEGDAGKVIIVNSTEDGFEYSDISSGIGGEDGTDGNTVLGGTVDPTTEGVDGDWYINRTSWHIWEKVSGTWTDRGSIKGTDGTDGVDGGDGEGIPVISEGDSGKVLAVKTDESGAEWIDAPSGGVSDELNAPYEKVKVHGSLSSNTTIAGSDGNIHTLTLGAAITLTLAADCTTGNCRTLTLIITNGGAYTITWSPTIKWSSETAPTLSATGVDILTITTVNAGTTWYGGANGVKYA